MSAKLRAPAPPSLSSKNSGGGMGGASDELINRYQQDLLLLTQKIADLSGEPQRAPAPPTSDGSSGGSSSFVNGLREITNGNNASELKLNMLMKIMSKISELDRWILKKTSSEEDKTPVKPRRGSRGMDLSSLPTHLHITDRLMDLHTKSQRVTVIKTGSSSAPESDSTASSSSSSSGKMPSSPRSGNDKKLIEKLTLERDNYKQKFEDAENKRKSVSEDCSIARKESSTLKRELEVLQEQMQKISTEGNSELQSELEKSQALLSESIQKQSHIESMLEVKANEVSLLMSELKRRCGVLTENTETVMESEAALKTFTLTNINTEGKQITSDTATVFSLSDEYIAYINEVDVLLSSVERTIQAQWNSLLVNRVSLESELSSSSTTKELLQSDLITLQEEHTALKAAYSQLQSDAEANNSRSLEKQLNLANDKLIELQAELAGAARKTLELERLPPQLAESEEKVRRLSDENIQAYNTNKELMNEVESYKQLCDSLKKKIKDMSGKDTREFMDSFEEVMQEEMMTMKAAFEGKLKRKTEDAEAMAARHRAEISRLSSSNSTNSLHNMYNNMKR